MERDTLEELIEQRLTQRQIANKLEVSQSTIRHWLKVHNLKTKRGPHGKVEKSDRVFKCPCGETDPNKFYGNHRFKCGKCHSRYTLEAGQRKRAKAIEYLGGSCVDCGFDKHSAAMDIHHLDPSTKDSDFNGYRGWAWKRIEKELQGCILLCKNCHAMRHVE